MAELSPSETPPVDIIPWQMYPPAPSKQRAIGPEAREPKAANHSLLVPALRRVLYLHLLPAVPLC